MKALGIDFGAVRIGIAASDDLGMLAHPVETITVNVEEEQTPDDAIPRIVEIVKERGIELIVVGHPIHMDGSPSTSSDKVEAWVELLDDELPEIDIELLDERLTTVEAERKLREAGKKAKDIKAIIDQAAAVVILQDYLDNEGGGGAALEEDPMTSKKSGRDLDLAAFADDDDDGGFGGVGGDEDDEDEDEDEFGTSWDGDDAY